MIRQAAGQIGVRMHGVRLNLRSNYGQLIDHVASLLDGYVCEPSQSPHLDVTGYWTTEPIEDGTSLFADAADLNGFGKRMQLSEDQLVWFDTHRDKNLQLRFHRKDGVPAFDVVYCYQPSSKKLAKYPDYEDKKFFDLLRYLVLFPIAWHLERTRGWGLVHASAVAAGNRGILIAGPGGAGKTTTCVALVARAAMTIVTENLLFSDGVKMFPVPEPIRLTQESFALLGGDVAGLRPLVLRTGRKDKSLFHLSSAADLESVRPAAIFIPQFAPGGFVRRIPPAVACELLFAVNRLTLEVNDYYWYTAALDLLWPQAGNAERQLAVLRRLTEAAPCYALGIDRSAGVDAVVDCIVDCLKLSREAVGGLKK